MSTSFKVSIPKPCDAKWEHMNPEEKSRHCTLCSQSVYSLDEFEESEAIDLLQRQVCVRVKSNAKGQIKVRGGFSTILLLGGLLACSTRNVGATEGDTEIRLEEFITEQPVELLQMAAGESVQVDLKGPMMPMMGTIATHVQDTPSVEYIMTGDVPVEQEELSEVVVQPIQTEASTKEPQEESMKSTDETGPSSTSQ